MSDVCEKHEISNCGECNGQARAHEQSLQDDTHWQRQQTATRVISRSSDIEYGPTIQANYAGHCKRCARRYETDSSITYSKTESGWIGACCHVV